MNKYLLVIEVAALSVGLFKKHRTEAATLSALAKNGSFTALKPSFPALTSTVQASLTTGQLPAQHGIVANGLYDHTFHKIRFWEQADTLCFSPRIWTMLKQRDPRVKTALFFWQNSLGSRNDFILTPAPIHKHHGGMIQDCYSQPAELYPALKQKLGAFNLKWYWGPFTSIKSSQWIARATAEVINQHQPHLVLTYLPHLDYNQQRWGPDDPRMGNEIKEIDAVIGELVETARQKKYEIIIVSDYGMSQVSGAVLVNRSLREAGFLKVRTVRGREYLDLYESEAFALVDHQVAHIYINTKEPKNRRTEELKKILGKVEGIEKVLDRNAQRDLGIDHRRSGDLVAISRKDKWFAYYWWDNPGAAPDYARHIDIHNKPGYDPCELFFRWLPPGIPLKPELVRGSHGRPPDSPDDYGIIITSFPVHQPSFLKDTHIFNLIKSCLL